MDDFNNEVNNYNGGEILHKGVDNEGVHVNTEVEMRHKVDADSHGTVDASRINIGGWEIGPYRRREADNRSVSTPDKVNIKEVEK